MKTIPIVNSNLRAIVDDADYDRLAKHRWRFKEDYVVRGYFEGNRTIGRKWKSIYMAREVMGVTDGRIVDHKYHNTLDNRKKHLRVCEYLNNGANMRQDARKTKATTSRFKGVHFDAYRARWISQITVNYQRIFIGRFDDELSAAAAYNEAAKNHFGSFACLNNLGAKKIVPQRAFDRRKYFRVLSVKQMLEAKSMRASGLSYPEIAFKLELPANAKQSVRQAVTRNDYYSPEELGEARRRGLIAI